MVEYLAAGPDQGRELHDQSRHGHGGIVARQVDVTIAGTNDAPILAAAAATGSVTEQVTPVGNLTSTGSIGFTDVDVTDVHTVTLDRHRQRRSGR